MPCLDSLRAFLALNSGNGDGSGDGSGYGDGSGSGDGDGDGSGSGYGYGYGYGDGSGDGSGDGDGDGSGSGYGYGDGSGDGDGDGSGSGSGYGYGDGYGYGYGIKSVNGIPANMIDGVATLISSIKGGVARGYILGKDLALKRAYVVRVGDLFAHGETIEQATADATEKHEENLPTEGRIDAFLERFPADRLHLGSNLLEGHRLLTGSCLQGREQFVKDHGIDLTKRMAIQEFCALTRNAYGAEVIRALEQRIQGETN